MKPFLTTIRFWITATHLAAVLLVGCATNPSGTPHSLAATPSAWNPPNLAELLASAVRQPATLPPGEGWQRMFDGRTLNGWRETDFFQHGAVKVHEGLMVLNQGNSLTGVNWTNPPPRMSYELTLEAMRVAGHDFFCGLTFPVSTNSCTLIIGGWGGGLIGISSIDHADASENETTQGWDFQSGRWYRIRVRVTPGRIEAWIDNERVVNVNVADRDVSMRPGEIELAAPLGISTYETTAAIRGVSYRLIAPDVR